LYFDSVTYTCKRDAENRQCTEGPPSLSPDGNQVTFERDGDIFVKQVDGEALVQLTKTGR